MPSYLPELTISNTKPDGPAALPRFVLLINSQTISLSIKQHVFCYPIQTVFNYF